MVSLWHTYFKEILYESVTFQSREVRRPDEPCHARRDQTVP